MAAAPKYKLYHGSTYIGSFKYSDDAETYCEAMYRQGKIIGELTIRSGHTKSSIELRYPQLVKDEPKELDLSCKYINVEVADGLVVSANLEGVEYGLSINDTGEEPADLCDFTDIERSCIAIVSSHGRFIVEAITGRVRSFMPSGDNTDYEWIIRFDITEYREWRGMRPAQMPIGGEIDMLLVGYWYVEVDEAGKPINFEHPCEEARQNLLEQLADNAFDEMLLPNRTGGC